MSNSIDVAIKSFEKLISCIDYYWHTPNRQEKELMKYRKGIARSAFSILQTDSSAYILNDIDSKLWSYCFYRLYSEERLKLQNCGQNELHSFFIKTNEGIEYYSYVIQYLLRNRPVGYKQCVYSMYMHIGDIYRYMAIQYDKNDKQNNQGKEIWKNCEATYKKAIQLNPNNGHAFHQLAVLATYRQLYCLALYYCIRSISCDNPFETAYGNVTYHFDRNKEILQHINKENYALPRKQAIEYLTCYFIKLHQLLYLNSITDEYATYYTSFCNSLQWCLEHDYISTQLMFRMFIIVLFAAQDQWRPIRDRNCTASYYITPSILTAWILLLSFVTYIMKYTAIPASVSKSHQLNLRHIPTLSLFLKWFYDQNKTDFRPPNYSIQPSIIIKSLPISQFEKVEDDFWKELELMRKRLPCVEIIENQCNKPIFFEIEVIGLRLFNQLFEHLLPTQEWCSGKEAEEVTLHTIHVFAQKLINKRNGIISRKRREEGEVIESKRRCEA